MRFAFGVFALVALFLFGNRAAASDFSPQQATSTVAITNTLFTAGTNIIYFTNYVEFANYHTFQSCIASTNICQVELSRSLDCINWTIVGTNTIAANAGVGEQTMTGKWLWVRLKVTKTNATGNIYYLGGR